MLCTHGDVMQDLLDHFGRHGVKLRDHRMEKGSIWEFDVEGGAVRRAHYVPTAEVLIPALRFTRPRRSAVVHPRPR